MSPWRTIETLANVLTTDAQFGDPLAKTHPRLGQLERVVEIGDSRCRKFCGGCGFRCSSRS
jgi:hypothetical protein